MKIRVDVIQEDIDNGCKADTDGTVGGGCMVYRAFMRATEGAFDGIRVESSEIGSWGRNEHGVYDLLWYAELPQDIEDLIGDFDNGRPVEPFAFDIEVPS